MYENRVRCFDNLTISPLLMMLIIIVPSVLYKIYKREWKDALFLLLIAIFIPIIIIAIFVCVDLILLLR